MITNSNKENQLGLLNLVVFVLSIYVLMAILVDTIFVLPKETSILLTYIDNTICVFFFTEFCIRFYKADDKSAFMRWGWIDLISSVPAISYLRAGRILRLIRLLRLIRAFRSTQMFVKYVFRNKAKGAFTSVTILAILLIIFSSIAILQVEKDPNSNIKSAEDAIWWSYVTITTIGYGDKFPVTTEGRIIAAILMTAGVGLFGTFTAYVSSWFVVVKE
ncbi:voltage-gated potassium channel [Pedobacter cryoconitis]|uniref:Voltage-gated potassium channel n=1 Tax=Pedobacter cryoconitis TaxID=188932 RepID=A0A7W8ZJ93_9SPHI|nr:potassium channel family protein [Pedobacter cryoconitis]MBB5635071.1 voltage-gated potassium channel [Pedobacter cryoconitis]MBB6271746.1 voltage-gated potassium channel [Pedobacter cryoconitis]